jgi:S-adenosylmethionine decarboxylase
VTAGLDAREALVDAFGCDAGTLRSLPALEGLFARVVRELDLHPVAGGALWHVFSGEAGITGLLLLAESHLACHTYPERGFATFNLYCCRPRAVWPWEVRLAEALGATRVVVRSFSRGEP